MEQEQFSELKSNLDALKERVSSQYEAQSARTTPPPSEWNEKQTENGGFHCINYSYGIG